MENRWIFAWNWIFKKSQMLTKSSFHEGISCFSQEVLDSTVLAAQMKQEAKETRLLSIYYGQRHSKELDHSQKIADHLGLGHEILKLPQLGQILSGSSLTDQSIILPEGHYAEESMKSTVVPNRNMILLALAGGHALSLGFDTIAYAAHAGDHTIYPDCRPEFADSMNKALGLADWKKDLNLHRLPCRNDQVRHCFPR